MKTLFTILLLSVISAYAQDCEHRTDVEAIEWVRILPPVETKLTTYDGKRIEYVIQDRFVTKIGSLEVTKQTLLPPDFAKNWRTKKLWIIFCGLHFVAYRIDYYDPQKPTKKPK